MSEKISLDSSVYNYINIEYPHPKLLANYLNRFTNQPRVLGPFCRLISGIHHYSNECRRFACWYISFGKQRMVC